MEVPIILYGSAVLRKHSADVHEEDDVKTLGENLSMTLKKAGGVGLAAPQINILKRAFAIDTTPMSEQDENVPAFEGIFINPVILGSTGRNVIFREGCLSIPDIFEEVARPESVVVRYQDTFLGIHEQEFSGIIARIFQHEYDHLEGILFIDKINLLRRKLISRKLNKIRKLSKH